MLMLFSFYVIFPLCSSLSVIEDNQLRNVDLMALKTKHKLRLLKHQHPWSRGILSIPSNN